MTDDPSGDLIEDYLRFLRGQGPEPDLSDLPPQKREVIAGQFEIVKALADRNLALPPLDQDPVDRRLGLLPASDGRAAVLREAADEIGRMDYDTDSNDYGYDTYRDAWNGGVMDAADLLRHMADEAPENEASA